MTNPTSMQVALTQAVLSSLQKRQPLPLSPQNYPLHGSEVNGSLPPSFHSGSGSYNHTPSINGADGIMGTTNAHMTTNRFF